jgi:serine/threonine protein kinase
MSKEAQAAAIQREKEIIAKARQQAQQSNVFDWASGEQDTEVTIDEFDLLKVIGRGSFGKVMLVKGRTTNELYAMKILKKEAILQRNQVEHTRAEREILASIDHPFLVKLHYAFQNDTKLYMIIDFCKGGELFYHLKNARRFPESRVQIYVGEITLGIEHLHSKGIIYRDLKPENVLLDDDGHLKLTDFGLSKVTNGEQALTFCGTPEYLAPEIIKGGGHGKEVDWWSLGVLMFEMLVGMSPFYSENQSAMYRMIQSSDVRIPSHISRNARDITQRLLTRDVARRLGHGERDGEEIRAHVFFESINWEDLVNRKIPAPFIPPVLSDDDCANFDEEFTCEPVVDSYAQKGKILSQNADAFSGFEFGDAGGDGSSGM